MIVREIIDTCANPHVARAAVLSIGGDFARRLSRDAAGRNVTSGLLASKLVREFACQAGEGDWERLDDAIRGADMPILSGLRHIIERSAGLKGREAQAAARPVPASAAWSQPDPGMA
ncbi:hypothetical protein DFR50_11133 [Roseiarcus fermentans]|uniref:Uncharacterized protein n=1 Tax=Roseiarcus fermentans TaxID=1473586 RepID=A0A366FGN9_9HYPH|nr:hypothetical protein [Roseiarcus fermentans]RBP13771.1 hypothetical protein DFR50_11133 [Roseiarcus fermentans]